MSALFSFYKPLRNQLRKLNLIESLRVIHGYIQHLQFGKPMPSDIETMPFFQRGTNRFDNQVYEWELDTLALELLVNAQYPDAGGATDTLRRWNCFATVTNKLRKFQGHLVSCYPRGSLLVEMHRIAHRQFPWQRCPQLSELGRYYKVLSHPHLDAIVQRKIGLGVQDLYLLGMALLGHFLDDFALDYPPHIEVPNLNQEKLDALLAHIAQPMSALRERTRQVHLVDVNYPYLFNPLQAYPLIRERHTNCESLLAPIPTFLFRRFTEGIYYEINQERGFDAAFREAFQSYVGEVIHRANANGSYAVYPEAEYWVGRERKDTVDWIIADHTAVLFVESKTKRLRLAAKTEICSTTTLEHELDKLADFLLQLYRTIRDYRDGYYPPHIGYDPHRKLYPIVLTLEEWFAFGPKMLDEVDRRLQGKLIEHGLDPDWSQQMPYSIIAASDFEPFLQVVARVGIDSVMAQKTVRPEPWQWVMGVFLRRVFMAECRDTRNLFPEVLDDITVHL
jgi:hypothetical protein